MMRKKIVIICLLVAAIVTIAAGVYVVVSKQNEERRLEARFDKFMGYFYPYFKDFSNAASIYKRMKISLMYDYLANHKGRYINETVNYYDGGVFSMADEFRIREFLDYSTMLYSSRAFGPISSAPTSRENERFTSYLLFDAIRQLLRVNIYDDNIEYDTAEQIEETLDSLNLEIQTNFKNLNKYRNSSKKIDLNTISDSDYDLNNY